MTRHVFHYSSKPPKKLSYAGGSEFAIISDELAERLECRVYLMKESQNTQSGEYLLETNTDTFHVILRDDTGSCGCQRFIDNVDKEPQPCEHIIKINKIKASGIQIEEPPEALLDAINALKSASPSEGLPGGGKTTYVCHDCGKQTNKQQAEKSFDEVGYIQCSDCYHAGKGSPGAGSPKPEPKKKGEKLPARREGHRSPAERITDAQRDHQIELAKARRNLKGGSTYPVRGEDQPDSKLVQEIANEEGISTEIIDRVQTRDYAEVTVRAHLGEHYVDAVVHHDFETVYQLKMLEIVQGNPEILDHWEDNVPVIKEKAKIRVKEGNREAEKDAKYFIVHALLSFKMFALRDASTKAMRIAQSKLLNQDFRDEDEKSSEEAEKSLVDEKIKNERAVREAQQQ